jgi:hypothetical protein
MGGAQSADVRACGRLGLIVHTFGDQDFNVWKGVLRALRGRNPNEQEDRAPDQAK